MATIEYMMFQDWAEKIARPFSSIEAAEAMGLDAAFVRRMIDGAHSAGCVRRTGFKGDLWEFAKRSKHSKQTSINFGKPR